MTLNQSTALESVLKRDRAVVLAGLVTLSALASLAFKNELFAILTSFAVVGALVAAAAALVAAAERPAARDR